MSVEALVVFLIALVVFVAMIPRSIWSAIVYVTVLGIVGLTGFVALVMFLESIQ